MRLSEVVVDLNQLRSYANTVIQHGGVSAVYLIGSATHSQTPRDIDLLYVLDLQLPPEAQHDDEVLWDFISKTGMTDEFDSFFQAGNTFWHLTWGAGPSLMRNDEYAAQQANTSKVLLASR